MSITEPAFDSLLSPAGAAARFWKTVVSVTSWLWTLRNNRKALREITEMEDWQLFDIGLKRSDLQPLITSRFFDDPTAHLVKITRKRGGSN